jgi:hypothetical protein
MSIVVFAVAAAIIFGAGVAAGFDGIKTVAVANATLIYGLTAALR